MEEPAPPVSREDWLRLVEVIAPRLGLGDKALRALRIIVTACRWADFAGEGPGPICFRKQQVMANGIGVTPGYFRKLEARLEAAGLIERRTCENGHRGRLGLGGPVAGLSLVPMLAGLSRWRAIERAMMEEAAALAEGRALIRIERRAARHAVGGLAEGHPLRARYDALRGERFPEARRYEDPTAIAAHLAELAALIETARAAQDHLDRSGAPRLGERRHTEDPIDLQTELCSGAPGDERGAPTEPEHPAGTLEPGREADGAGDDEVRDTQRRVEPETVPPSRLPPALLRKLTPAALRELGSEELQLYVDHLDPHRGPVTLRDVERAALMRRRELKITPEAWNEVEATLGWLDALVALIVIDRNRTHPKTPVRNPGGLLRDLARRRMAGTLDLGATVMGVWRRDAS